MSALSSHLHFAPSSAASTSARSPIPPAGAVVLVTDTLAASADFLLAHFVGAQLKRGRRVVFVGLGEAEGHWRALGKKLGTPLEANANFTFVDALSQAFAFAAPASAPMASPSPTAAAATCPPLLLETDDAPLLRPLYDVVHSALKGKGRAPVADAVEGESEIVLVLEGLNSLAWSGVAADDIGRLARALQNLSSELRFSTILHLHTTPSTGALPTDELFQALHPAADLWVEVRGLSSGRSADVSGELAFFPSPLMADDPAFPATAKGKELQYKLGDATVDYFAKGTGRGFL